MHEEGQYIASHRVVQTDFDTMCILSSPVLTFVAFKISIENRKEEVDNSGKPGTTHFPR